LVRGLGGTGFEPVYIGLHSLGKLCHQVRPSRSTTKTLMHPAKSSFVKSQTILE